MRLWGLLAVGVGFVGSNTPVSAPAIVERLPISAKVVGSSLTQAANWVKAHAEVAYPDWARKVARAWVGRPYRSGGAGLGPEKLLVNLEQMDCMTAIENLMALHVASWWQQAGYFSEAEAFLQALLRVRYHSLPPCRWEDRYHYLTHAFLAWEAAGFGSWLPLGQPDKRTIRYISSHKKQYGGFSDWRAIGAVEATLTKRLRFYIPETELADWLPLLQDGDIVAFIPEDSTLDVSHVGVFFWEGGRPTFAHASSIKKQWVWGEDLCAYLDRRSKVIGITVFRPASW